MFSAVTHVLKEAANGAMYLVGASETREIVEDDQPIVLSNDELKPVVVEPTPETVQATPAPPAVPPPPVSVIPPASAPPAEKEETKHDDEESGDEFDLSKWKK